MSRWLRVVLFGVGLVGLFAVGLVGLFAVWTVLQGSIPNGLLLTALAFGGLITGWLWIIKIGRDAGNV